MKFSKVNWPDWPVDNALAKLEETRKLFETSKRDPEETFTQGEYALKMQIAMEHMTHVIKGINDGIKPQPPDPRVIVQRAFSRFFNGIANGLESAADALRSVDDWDYDR